MSNVPRTRQEDNLKNPVKASFLTTFNFKDAWNCGQWRHAETQKQKTCWLSFLLTMFPQEKGSAKNPSQGFWNQNIPSELRKNVSGIYLDNHLQSGGNPLVIWGCSRRANTPNPLWVRQNALLNAQKTYHPNRNKYMHISWRCFDVYVFVQNSKSSAKIMFMHVYLYVLSGELPREGWVRVSNSNRFSLEIVACVCVCVCVWIPNLSGNFGPEKKYLAPPPQIPKHPPGRSPPCPPRPPPPGIFNKKSSPPTPAPRTPPSPPPNRKKLKISETSTQ